MSGYLTEKIINRDTYVPCEVCKKGIHESVPRIEVGDSIEICTDCMVGLIETFAKLSGMGGVQPFILKAILESVYDRKKRIPIPKKIRDYIFSMFNRSCAICGLAENLEIDHIHPYSKGGTNDPSNLQVLCKPCNIKKSNNL